MDLAELKLGDIEFTVPTDNLASVVDFMKEQVKSVPRYHADECIKYAFERAREFNKIHVTTDEGEESIWQHWKLPGDNKHNQEDEDTDENPCGIETRELPLEENEDGALVIQPDESEL